MKDEIKTIAEQINWRELKLAGFKFVYDDKQTSLTLIKGKKYLSIKYDFGLDTYTLKEIITKKFAIISEKELQNIYCDQLQEIINNFFNFEYLNINFKTLEVKE